MTHPARPTPSMSRSSRAAHLAAAGSYACAHRGVRHTHVGPTRPSCRCPLHAYVCTLGRVTYVCVCYSHHEVSAAVWRRGGRGVRRRSEGPGPRSPVPQWVLCRWAPYGAVPRGAVDARAAPLAERTGLSGRWYVWRGVRRDASEARGAVLCLGAPVIHAARLGRRTAVSGLSADLPAVRSGLSASIHPPTVGPLLAGPLARPRTHPLSVVLVRPRTHLWACRPSLSCCLNVE